MADLRFDLRIAIRRLTRAPVFAIVAIGTLALAIGATTAIYSIVRSVLLRPIPLPSPDRLVRVYGTTGIRMALGAAPDAIVRLVFERGAALVALGTVAGTAGAIGMGRLADALLYDTSSRDPFILLAVAGIVMTAGLAASAIPALRSSRIDPASMLRGDA